MDLLFPQYSSSFPTYTFNNNINNNNNKNLTLFQETRSPIRLIKAASEEAEHCPSPPVVTLEQPGGKMVVELVGAFNQLATQIMSSNCSTSLSSNSSHILFKSLKLSIPILHTLPVCPDSRSPLDKALSLALLLANLQMDAEVISAGILREVLEAGALSIHQVRNRIGIGTAHLLHDSFRVKNMLSRMDVLDDETAAALRKYCLTYYDVRAVILDLALKLEAMRHLDYLPSHETGSKPLIDTYKDHLLQCLKSDPLLGEMVDDISVKGRYKTRYSTMKKLLKDGRRPEDVYDILGLRVVLKPISGENLSEFGNQACYRAREIIRSIWKEIPMRAKDYIARPKANGYKSLHMAVDVSGDGKKRPLMEIQIRTEEMDMTAGDGMASHSLYKGGLTDPEEAKRLKAIMMAAAELAATRLKDLPLTNHKEEIEIDQRDRVFLLLDKNGDGKISIEELMEVMEELGAQGEDALEMMQLLDANSDGSLSSDEFDMFQKQVELMRNLEDKDDQYKSLLNKKLEVADDSGFIQLYREESEEGLAVS